MMGPGLEPLQTDKACDWQMQARGWDCILVHPDVVLEEDPRQGAGREQDGSPTACRG